MSQAKYWGFRILMILAMAISLTMVFNPTVSSSIRAVFKPEHRTVLSTLSGVFKAGDVSFHVVKVKTQDGLFVEIYSPPTESSPIADLVDRIELPRHRDAFFTFNGQATNLAIDDVDGDSTQELLVPSLDSQLVAHLNIFRFNSASGRFETAQPEEFK